MMRNAFIPFEFISCRRFHFLRSERRRAHQLGLELSSPLEGVRGQGEAEGKERLAVAKWRRGGGWAGMEAEEKREKGRRG